MPLNDLQIKNAKPGTTPYKLADGGGLYLHIRQSGTKSWRMDYRFALKRKTITFGLYPSVGLADARAARDQSRVLLARGEDPSTRKKLDKIASVTAQATTFGLIAAEYIEKMKRDGRAAPTITKNEWMMLELARPLTRRPIGELTAAEILVVLRGIEKSGRIESALATRSAIGRVFRYAIATARVDNDPTYALRGALQTHKVISHAAVTAEDKIPGLMKAVFGYQGWPTLTAALKIQALCFARPGETRSMEWSELHLSKGRWVTPGEKAKMRRAHDVPLSRQAVEVIEALRPLSGGGRFVFPSMMSGKAVLSENSMNSALRRMGFAHDEHTAHGFRSTASTVLNESGLFSSDVIEAQLAHYDKNEVRRVYNRAHYWEERTRMMQWWSDYVMAAIEHKGG